MVKLHGTYYAPAEAAAYLGVQKQQIAYLINRGVLCPSARFARFTLFEQHDLEAAKVAMSFSKKRGAPNDRDKEFIAMHAAGKTLEEIGLAYNLTRERVRQRLALCGVKKTDGGSSLKARARSVKRAATRRKLLDKRAMSKFGVTADRLAELRDTHPLHVRGYMHLRHRSGRERIPLNISLPDYIDIVGDRIGGYGRKKLVLHRIDPDRGYERENLTLISHVESSALGRRCEKVLDLWGRGLGPTEIGRRLGVLPGTVSSMLTQAHNAIKFTTPPASPAKE